MKNKAGYTAISCGRVGRGGNARFLTFRLDGYGRTDGPTDRPTDKASYRVACPQLKRHETLFSRVHATLHPALSVGRSVGWSVGLLVGLLVGLSVCHTFTFFTNFISLSHLKSFKSKLSHSPRFKVVSGGGE